VEMVNKCKSETKTLTEDNLSVHFILQICFP